MFPALLMQTFWVVSVRPRLNLGMKKIGLSQEFPGAYENSPGVRRKITAVLR